MYTYICDRVSRDRFRSPAKLVVGLATVVHVRTSEPPRAVFGRGDDTVGSSHRAPISQFELFELILLLILDKQFPVEQFEATVSQSTLPSPHLEFEPFTALGDTLPPWFPDRPVVRGKQK